MKKCSRNPQLEKLLVGESDRRYKHKRGPIVSYSSYINYLINKLDINTFVGFDV